MMDMNFCRRCGAKLDHVKDHIYKCTNGHTLFANSSPAVGIFFVTPDNHVLLSERGIEPRKGMLDSFGGFVDPGESFETAAIRELREELSLEPEDYEELAYLTSATGNYPYQNDILPVISVFFWTRLKTGRPLQASDDVAAVRRIPLQEVDLSLLHDDDVRTGIQKLQQRLLH